VTPLLHLALLRLRCRAHGIARLEAGPKALAATFRDQAAAERLWSASAGGGADRPRWSSGRLLLARASESAAERLAAAAAFLDLVAAPSDPPGAVSAGPEAACS
jgi:transcription-repair coupling factor (superfamily II helicase)